MSSVTRIQHRPVRCGRRPSARTAKARRVTQSELAERVLRTYLATGREVSTKQLARATKVSEATLTAMLGRNRACYFAQRINLQGRIEAAWLPARSELRRIVREERTDHRLYQRDFDRDEAEAKVTHRDRSGRYTTREKAEKAKAKGRARRSRKR